jgi:predicted enzyme related to lactoylglutathione lyase
MGPSALGKELPMHRSQLCGFIIDCQTSDLKTAAEFWSHALGMEQKSLPGQEGENYVRLVDPRDYVHVEVQSVTHPSRVHLDIESDDIEAEVQRLERLGAKRIQQVRTWWVLEAPTGQRFCVVRPQSPKFADTAHRWP